MKKVVIFCRVSSNKQDVESQLIQTKQYAIELGYAEEDFPIIIHNGDTFSIEKSPTLTK